MHLICVSRLARWLYRRMMQRVMKKEMVEEEVAEVFTISREGLGEGGQVQVNIFPFYGNSFDI